MNAVGHINQADFETYLYHITHDLKASLRAIKTLPEWIDEDMTNSGLMIPGPVREHMDMLGEHTLRLDLMVSGLTEWSRVGRLSSDAAPHRLADLVQTAWQGLAPGPGFTLDCRFDCDLALGPRNDLDRLFQAVLSNAICHHDRETGQVLVASKARDGRVWVQITDDGPGIAQKFADRIFEPLHTLKSKDECNTAGMGLAVARKVVGMLGGEIRLVPVQGNRGACFEFDLPAG